MKFIKSILFFSVLLISQLGISQDLVTPDEALQKIELKQEETETLFRDGSISALKKDVINLFIKEMAFALKESVEVEESLNIAIEKCLPVFSQNQDEVILFKEELTLILTIN